MHGCKPNKANQRRFEIIREIGCIISHREGRGWTPAQIHHITGTKTQEDHERTLGLSYWHHMADQQNPPNTEYTSRHPNKKAFENRYGTEQELLEYQNELIEEYDNRN